MKNANPDLSRRSVLLVGARIAAISPLGFILWRLVESRETASVRSIESFFGAGGDRADASRPIEAAADWSSRGGGTVVFSGRYGLRTPVLVSRPDVRFAFEDAIFEIADEGREQTLTNGASGPIAILFQKADRARVMGRARFIGGGERGETRLAGLVFDSCREVECGEVYFEAMAMGRGVFWCAEGRFGAVTAKGMAGKQTFDPATTAGSAQVVVGCRNCSFGPTTGEENYKPVLYCSVALARPGGAVDNENCSFGMVAGTPAKGSAEAALIAIRSARNSRFEGCRGDGFPIGVYVVKYPGDEAWSVHGNSIGRVTGAFASSAASVDAAFVQECQANAGEIGLNRVETIDADCSGEFGLLVTSGGLSFGRVRIVGGARPAVIYGATVRGDRLEIRNQGLEALTIGRAADVAIQSVAIQSGTRGGAGSAIRLDARFGSGGGSVVSLSTVQYQRNGVGRNLNTVIYGDAESRRWRLELGAVDSAEPTAQVQFGSVRYRVRGRTLAPTN